MGAAHFSIFVGFGALPRAVWPVAAGAESEILGRFSVAI